MTITDLASKFLAQESDSAEAGNSVVAPHGSSGDLGVCARFEVVERREKAH